MAKCGSIVEKSTNLFVEDARMALPAFSVGAFDPAGVQLISTHHVFVATGTAATAAAEAAEAAAKYRESHHPLCSFGSHGE